MKTYLFEYNHEWTNEYQIVQCKGCEAVSFRKTHINSEDYIAINENDEKILPRVNVYPNPEESHRAIEYCHMLPIVLQHVYAETIKAINSGQAVLTGIGIRAIIETVCKDKDAKGKELYEMINNLVKQGVLTEKDANILHKLRNLGNEAAHEAKLHDNFQLKSALDVIDHLLQGVYILPYRSGGLNNDYN